MSLITAVGAYKEGTSLGRQPPAVLSSKAEAVYHFLSKAFTFTESSGFSPLSGLESLKRLKKGEKFFSLCLPSNIYTWVVS